ncbi:MAG: hypothetical protein DA405_01585 [Bacteroidetes bacterium]|nr:MAG: hypothetical protein DA405_01585 [Bacteroidota bacterium]
MKKILFAFSILLSLSASAQFDFGLRAGASLSNPRIENFKGITTISDFQYDASELSYQAGVYARVKLLAFFVQGELYFTKINQSAKASFTALNVPPKTIDLSYSRIDLPILLGLKIGPIRIVGGPMFSSNFNDVSGNLNNDLKAASLGYQVGIGAEFSKLFVDLRYESGLGNMANAVLIDNSSYQSDIRTNQIMLCLGFELF